MRSNLLYRRNPLAFPSGRMPGFDASHIAARGAYLSAVPGAGNNYYNVLTGDIGTNTGLLTATILGALGPAVNYPAPAKTVFSNLPAITTQMTCAAFFQVPSYTTTQVMLHNTGGNNIAGAIFFASTTNLTVQQNGSNTTLFTGGLVNNAPYFAAFSQTGTTGNAVLLNLATGTLLTVSKAVTAAILTSANNNPILGAFNSGNGLIGNLGPVMISGAYFPLSTLVAWAQDPWAFWYPRQTEFAPPAPSNILYAAFTTSQRDGPVYTQMIGY